MPHISSSTHAPLVRSIKEKCRVCYTCVRECPAKAIRILQGQADVVAERCIGCGNCFRVCSQNAKEVLSSKKEVEALLSSGWSTAAMLAPSFPAEFGDIDFQGVVGALKKAGFLVVSEVAFGADLVSLEYRKLLAENKGKHYIASTCPAVVSYIEKYHPALVDSLAPIASPMVATARALRRKYGKTLKTVFIGPCIAKKGETKKEGVPDEIDAVMTYTELREFLAERKISPESAARTEFDPPHAGKGRLYAIARGFLESAALNDDLLSADIVATDGRENFISAIKEFETGALKVSLLEILCCQGCIMGAGISSKIPLFQRKALVSRYTKQQLSRPEDPEAGNALDAFRDLDLSRKFSPSDQRLHVVSGPEIEALLRKMGKFKPEDELNCGACGYETCRDHALAMSKELAESEMCLPYTIDQLRKNMQELAAMQSALLQSEKLASMGQLAAGIAHEVNNPLGVVIMFAHLLLERLKDNPGAREDLNMIVEQADRCKRIISGMLNFARQNKAVRQPASVRKAVDDALRAVKLPANIRARVDDHLSDPMAEIDCDQIIQALFNLITNAQAAMPAGGTLTLGLSGDAESVTLTVGDEGVGIPEENLKKVFEPFFTTKQIGRGTGLGLAVTYGIVKMHRGEIRVESNADKSKGKTGTTITITIPRKEPVE